MAKKAAFFHTVLATPAPMKAAFHERFPDAELITMVDDSVLPEVLANGNLPTPAIVKRLADYASIAAQQGAGVFVCMCTTLGIAVREAQKAVSIPMLTIDGPMLRQAVETGKKIGMLITFPPTERTSKAAALAFAADAGRDVTVDVIVVDGARDALNAGDKATHDRLIAEKAQEAASVYDVLVFAQVTMLDAAAQCGGLGVPVLTSVKSGIEQLAEYLT